MTKTVSFVARDELAEWLEQEAENQMTSISAVCQQVVAEEYRRRRGKEYTGDENDATGHETEVAGHVSSFEMRSRPDAEEVREAFEEYVSDEDDARFNEVHFTADLPRKHYKELERRSIN